MKAKSPKVKVRFIISCVESVTLAERDLDEAVAFAKTLERENRGCRVEVQFSWNNGVTWQDEAGGYVKKPA